MFTYANYAILHTCMYNVYVHVYTAMQIAYMGGNLAHEMNGNGKGMGGLLKVFFNLYCIVHDPGSSLQHTCSHLRYSAHHVWVVGIV